MMKYPIIIKLWYHQKFRSFLFQSLIVLLILLIAFFLWQNIQIHLKEHESKFGFEFLQDTAGFGILMHLIDYNEHSSYGRAFCVGLVNTLVVSSLGIFFASIFGLMIGIARSSTNRLFRYVATYYIEIIRNIPLLLQIFFWYF